MKRALRHQTIVGLCLVASAALAGCGSDAKTTSPPTSSETGECGSAGDAVVPTTEEGIVAGAQVFTGMSNNHVAGCVKYLQEPPVGGNHSGQWQACNYYDTPITTERGVHSMEHGAVWITFSPSIDAADRDKLRSLASNEYVLISQWGGTLPSSVVASAWGVQLRLTGVADPKLQQFVDAYANGAQTPEPGAPCRDGGLTDA